jgi:DNA-binding SARP family transcriptional activator
MAGVGRSDRGRQVVDDRANGKRVVTSVDLLGSFELRHDGRLVPVPLSAQRLLAFLALRGGVLKRVYVAGMLWVEKSQDAANANLRTTLWRLRRVPYRLIDATATHLSLAGEVVIDIHEVAAIAGRVRNNPSDSREEDLDRIMLAGEVLPDWYDDWVLIERERVKQLRLHALETLSVMLTREGRYGKAIEAGLVAVADEPLRESAHRAVMCAHLAEGNPSEALRQYELCRRLLGEQLGFEPSPETELLRRHCASGDVAVTAVR